MVTILPGCAKPVRRNELDWLRTLAVLGLIPFHAAVIFTTGSGDYVKNAETSRSVDAFVAFISAWGMPLIFFIAGAGARFALQLHTPPRYLRERFSRLVVPFLFGLVAVVPLQVYIGRIASTGMRPAFIPIYLEHMALLVGVFGGTVPHNGADWIGHLWFIPMLILFAVLIVPADRFFHAGVGLRLLALLARYGQGLGLLAVLGLLLGIARFLLWGGSALSPDLQQMASWSLFVQFLLFYLFGYVVYADPRSEMAVRKAGLPALVLASLTWGIQETLNVTHTGPADGMTVAYAGYSLLSGYASWLWVVAIVSYGMRYLAGSNGLLRFLSDAAYPAYVLHMPILSLIALYVVRWDLPLLEKLVFITLATLAATLAVYDVLIRRIGIVRMVFGLKPRSSRTPPGSTPDAGPSQPPEPIPESASAKPAIACGAH
jgi:glucans biosynthesis protein C